MLYHNFVKIMHYIGTFYIVFVLEFFNSTRINHP